MAAIVPTRASPPETQQTGQSACCIIMMKKATCLLLLVAVAQYCAAVPLTPNKNLAVDPNVVDEINSDNETEW
eukprot:655618-Rhodomonas_salina.1